MKWMCFHDRALESLVPAWQEIAARRSGRLDVERDPLTSAVIRLRLVVPVDNGRRPKTIAISSGG